MDRARTPAHVAAIDRPVALPADLGELPVLWWVPRTRPVVAVAWLQHGYARNPRYLNALASALASAGLVVAMPTVESFRRRRSINDERFLAGIGTALAGVVGREGTAHAVVEEAAVDVEHEALARLVLVAHSAGCAVVAAAARQAMTEGTALRGAVLLDATDNLARSFTTSIDALRGLTIRGVFAQPGRCNRKGQGALALLAARAGYAGVRLTSGTHCDAEGHDTDRVCRTLCGKPDPANVELLYDATTAWVRSIATGPPDPAWEPGGDRVDSAARSGRVELLYGTRSD